MSATLLISRQGWERLQAEYLHLWRVERPETTKIVAWAASLGDRSENADYHYNKKRLREIDRRLRYLKRQFEQLKIVDYHPTQAGKVYFGAWVSLVNDVGQTLRFRIVGPDEILHHPDYVSIDAPIARACISKVIGDSVIVNLPGKTKAVWEVDMIEYNLT